MMPLYGVAVHGILFILLFLAHPLRAIKITGPTGGVDAATAARPCRYEIHQFSQSGPAFDLFILSLKQLQAQNQSNPLSYFQISGIHGYPQIPWDGVVGTGTYPGFCMHASTPFPVWHRPYVALYEQALWNIAQTIAGTFPSSQRDQYQAAALTLRVPYWDWAAYPALPEAVVNPTISINTPTGPAIVDNPLHQYTFQDNAAGNGFPASHPLADFRTTVRWWDSPSQSSNQSAANATLLANAPTILATTYQLLTAVTDYTNFSCTWPGGQTNTANNIENIHNGIHSFIGGFGHMAFPEMAGFDPIFWMHHAQVDRLLAMWQVLNQNSYIVPTVNAFGSYYESVGTVDSGNTALAPFHSDNGTTMFTPDTVRNIAYFGYSYPGLTYWNTTASDLVARVRQNVNSLYNPDLATSKRRCSKKGPIKRTSNLAEDFGHVTFDMVRSMSVNNLDVQWGIRIVLDRFAYDSNFVIDFFIGNPPEDVHSWATAPNLVGTHAQFIAATVSDVHPNRYPQGKSQGEVSLTHTLAAGVSRGFLEDLSPVSVVPLLRKALNWRARTADGREIDVHSLSGLSISVGSRPVQPTTSMDQFPVYGPTRWHDEVTESKPGGGKCC